MDRMKLGLHPGFLTSGPELRNGGGGVVSGSLEIICRPYQLLQIHPGFDVGEPSRRHEAHHCSSLLPPPHAVSLMRSSGVLAIPFPKRNDLKIQQAVQMLGIASYSSFQVSVLSDLVSILRGSKVALV